MRVKVKKRKLYLASASPARKTLLSLMGIDFKVIPVRVDESGYNGMKTGMLSGLVRRNALLKARCAAEGIKEGIVIAADTLTAKNGRVYGKPADIKEARAMLRKLSGGAQDIYTGLAVLEKKSSGAVKTASVCEKSRVYMDKISGAEIDSYFSKQNPLNKAGGFDIQGSGAFFIRGISGCFYNVVGLPLRSMYRLLKSFGVNILLCVLMVFSLSGCASEYNIVTGKQEAYYYSTDKEVRLGRSIAASVEREYRLSADELLQKRARDIGNRLSLVCDRRDINYEFKVLDDKEINAVSLPGGFVYINSGLIEKTDSDDELAGVIAHEIGHIVARHSVKKLQGVSGYTILRILAAQVPDSGAVGTAADAAFSELMSGYSREDELLADQLAVRYLQAAGYRPEAMITFLEKLWQDTRRRPLRPKSYYKTHPYVPDRIRVVKEALGNKMDFDDYINIEQLPAK